MREYLTFNSYIAMMDYGHGGYCYMEEQAVPLPINPTYPLSMRHEAIGWILLM